MKAHFKCAEDPFCKIGNPNGYINLGTAENFLMDSEIKLKLKEVCENNSFKFHYDEPQGSLELRSSYVEFQKKFLNINIYTQKNIVFASGASAIIEMITNSICDEKDEVLILAPLYNGFYHDVEARFNGVVTLSNSLEGDDFSKEIFEKDVSNNTKLKAVIINNPHNPTGKNFSRSELRSIIEICKKNNLEIISDEIYANSVYGEEKFTSMLNSCFGDLNYMEKIHHVYGMAKDFCMSGLKVGVFSSLNPNLTKAMAAQAYFYTVSTQTQKLACELFSSERWCEDFFELNRNRLKELNLLISSYLNDFQVELYPATAGIFMWVDFSKSLGISTFKDEERVQEMLLEKLKINMTPGQCFGSLKPGFFRVCFAKPEITILEFLKRIKPLLKSRS